MIAPRNERLGTASDKYQGTLEFLTGIEFGETANLDDHVLAIIFALEDYLDPPVVCGELGFLFRDLVHDDRTNLAAVVIGDNEAISSLSDELIDKQLNLSLERLLLPASGEPLITASSFFQVTEAGFNHLKELEQSS